MHSYLKRISAVLPALTQTSKKVTIRAKKPLGDRHCGLFSFTMIKINKTLMGLY